MKIDDIKIDPELEALLPALPDERREGLRQEIIADGKVRDRLIVWKGHGILLDGHNRLSIYKAESEKHLIDPPGIEEMEFPTRLDAMKWMVKHQDSRRNWTKIDADYALGKINNEEKKSVGRPQKPLENKDKKNGVKDDTISETPARRTVERVAEEHGVSVSTVHRASKLATALDKIRTVNVKASDDIRAGTIKLKQAEVIALADSGDIAKGLTNLRLHGDWRGKQEETTAEPEKPASKVPAEIAKRIALLDKSYNVIGGHVSWLKANAKKPATQSLLDVMDGALKKVFDGIQSLKKQIQ